ncbi:hypothetical protein J8F10_24525 [Gemmata sp. G18]|uniref:Uncharacterized protein n=1 Tax=Gemmata palustris TaxID=2822762 RepID=A0ABS5BXE8_9BACT|nr:hypothetical protein [Gemmata palustris]MBP3958426.1 hypothetical protein [Gemmata palustris]
MMNHTREKSKPVRRDVGHTVPSGPVPFAHPDHSLQLNWPFAQYADALLKLDEAKKREWAATVTGDHNARELASFDMLEALTEVQKVRDSAGQLLAFCLRVALEDDHAGTFRALLNKALGMDHLRARLDQLEARLDEVEDGVLAINRGEVLV